MNPRTQNYQTGSATRRVTVVCLAEDEQTGYRCPNYGKPIRYLFERQSSHVFMCDTCGVRRMVTKRTIGGTHGAGLPNDARQTTYGRGVDPKNYVR